MHEHAARMQQGDSRSDATILPFPRPTLHEHIAECRLQWFPEIGVGYFPVTESPYDQAYFDRFAEQADSHIGRKLMASRVEFVEQYYSGWMVGIGSGAFIERRNATSPTFGFDINPAGVAWLKERDLWCDPYAEAIPAISMWDVLEHMHDFRPLLAKVRHWLFLALPIFGDAEHVLRSKHYRRDEHCWYWTRRGLVTMMHDLKFELIADSNMEMDAGREDIGAFAFRRQ
jgi:hypothetical protein